MSAVLENPARPPRARDPLVVKNILVPVDFSRTSLEALRYAVPIARRFRAKITLLHVLVELPYPHELGFTAKSENQLLDAVEHRLDRLAELTIGSRYFRHRVVRVGDAAEAIALVAREEKSDLVILTTHGWTGFKRFAMGSTAEKAVRLSPCPVLAVRVPEHEPPEAVRQDLADLLSLSSDI